MALDITYLPHMGLLCPTGMVKGPFSGLKPATSRTPGHGSLRGNKHADKTLLTAAFHDRDTKGCAVMGFLAFLILGLIAGAIAKAILPGTQGGGWVITLVLGVVGAILGGWIGSLIFGGGLGDFFDLRTWLLSILGAVIVLLIYGAVAGRRSRA